MTEAAPPEKRPGHSELDLVIQHTAHALIRLRGETATQALATQLVRRFQALDAPGQDTFFRFLLDDLGPDTGAVDAAIAAYSASPTQHAIADLAEATESARLRLFRTVNTAPGGISCLLEMRAALLDRHQSFPELHPVERDLAHLLRSWFNRGFLELRQLDWQTPAHILEKLIKYEAVHEIQGWGDLQRRLAPDRRSFGFFHPSLPDEPIIFVEVALTQGMAESIQNVLTTEPAPTDSNTDTAIFYSITNCQRGLSGISFGSFLIKQVSDLLGAELPLLVTFATLSPIPGFAAWLSEQEPIDLDDREAVEHACATYLLGARRNSLPSDPVARFHLRNGARIERLNWNGDTSEKGREESHGMLVNYRYSGQDLEANHDALVLDGVVIAHPMVIDSAGNSIDSRLVAESPASVAP
ncbi:MAG: malonyl-CoA decarboxylase [Verrucomicrobiales bacterium]|jgi:malonyl-CoA decarboxylase